MLQKDDIKNTLKCPFLATKTSTWTLKHLSLFLPKREFLNRSALGYIVEQRGHFKNGGEIYLESVWIKSHNRGRKWFHVSFLYECLTFLRLQPCMYTMQYTVELSWLHNPHFNLLYSLAPFSFECLPFSSQAIVNYPSVESKIKDNCYFKNNSKTETLQAAAPSYSEEAATFISEYWFLWMENALVRFWLWKEKPWINQSGQKLRWRGTNVLYITNQQNSRSYWGGKLQREVGTWNWKKRMARMF